MCMDVWFNNDIIFIIIPNDNSSQFLIFFYKDTYGTYKDTYGTYKDTYGTYKDTYGTYKDTWDIEIIHLNS